MLTDVLIAAVVVEWLVAGAAIAVAWHMWVSRERLRSDHVRLLTRLARGDAAQILLLLVWGVGAAVASRWGGAS